VEVHLDVDVDVNGDGDVDVGALNSPEATFRRRPRCQAECNENEAKCTAGIWPLSVCNKNFSFGVRLWVASQKSRWCMALFRPLGAAHFWLTRVLAASAVPGH